MKKQLTKLALTVALGLALAFIISCGKGGDAKLLEAITDENGNVQKRFEYDKQNRIVKINDETITYANNLVTVGTKKYAINGNTITADGNSLTINKDGYIVVPLGNSCSEECPEYFVYKDDNLIADNSGIGIDYKYDNKKSPFSGSATPKWLMQILLGDASASKNNVVHSGSENAETTYKYEYDSDGFPVSVTATSKYYEGCEQNEKCENTTITRYTYSSEKQNTAAKTDAAASAAEAAETATDNDEPKFFKCEVSDTGTEEAKWNMGVTNGDCTRLVGGSSKKHTRAVIGSQMLKIKYIGEKKEHREPRDMESYFNNYETSCGAEYEIIGSKVKECGAKNFFLYNDSDKWGGVPDKIVFKNEGNYPRLKASKDEIAAMEKLQNGRKIILTEVIADFSIEGKSNRLMLARYKNSKKDGLFQIVLRDHNNDYFTADFPSDLDENGQPNWRADMGDDIGGWELYFVGRIAEGLFLVTEWCAAEGCGVTTFVAKNGKLENWQDKGIVEASATYCSCGKEECEKEGPKTIEAVFLENDDSDSEGLAYSRYRLANGEEIRLNGFAPDDVKKDDKVSVTFKVMESKTFGEGDVMECAEFNIIISVIKK